MKKRIAKKITQASIHGRYLHWKFSTVEKAFQTRFPDTWEDSMVKFITLGMFMRNVKPLAKAFNAIVKATKVVAERVELFGKAIKEIVDANPGIDLNMSNEELAA